MKQIYLLLFLAGFLSQASAQQKSEFGFVVKAGNFTLPYQHKDQTYYYSDQRTSTYIDKQNSGNMLAFGIKESLRMGRHFRISGELLYRLASFSTENVYKFGLANGTLYSTTSQTQHVNESSLSIPLKLHFSFRRNGWTTVAVGAGISRVLHGEIKGHYATENKEYPQNSVAYSLPGINLEMESFSPEISYSAGIYQRINEYTSIGMEFNYERHLTELQYSPLGLSNIDLICNCYGYVYLNTPSIRNLTVSLSHILSR